MYAELFLLRRLPKRFATFTYLVPPELTGQIKVGQAVATTFRGRKTLGLVVELKSYSRLPAERLVEIKKILGPEPLLSANQRRLIDWFCAYYLCSLPLAFKTWLPPLPQKITTWSPQTTPWEAFSAAKVKAELTASTTLFWYQRLAEVYNFLFSQLKNTSGQTLILMPEIDDFKLAGNFLDESLRLQTAVFHSRLSQSEHFALWQKISRGETKIVVATRPGVFLPWQDLKTIIIWSEADESFKQWDQNPRYDARTVAEELARRVGAKLLLLSPAPRVETYQKIQTRKIALIKPSTPAPGLKVVNLKDEIAGGNYSLLSAAVEQAIIETKNRGTQTYLYLNRRGLARAVICGDCGYVFNCPNCSLPLPLHRGGQLKCHHCGQTQALPAACPHCHGVRFRFPGQGTQSLEKQLATLWPGLKVARLDLDSDLKTNNPVEIAKADVYLGTTWASKKIPWANIQTVAILSLDNLLSLPDFRAGERFWQTVQQLRVLANQTPGVAMFLQTFRPDSPIIKDLVADRADQFYQRESAERADLLYPPFGYLAKLIYQSTDRATAEKQAEKLYQQLTNRADKAKIKIQISQPYLVSTGQVRGRWRYLLTLKSGQPLQPFLTALPDDWLVDIDPIDLN